MQYFYLYYQQVSTLFQYISSCLTIRFDNISMTSLVFSNRLCRFYCLTFNFSVKFTEVLLYLNVRFMNCFMTKRIYYLMS